MESGEENAVFVDLNDPHAIWQLQELGVPIDADGMVDGVGLQAFFREESNFSLDQFNAQDSQPISSASDSDIQDIVIEPVDPHLSDESNRADCEDSTDYFSDGGGYCYPVAPDSPWNCLNCDQVVVPNIRYCCRCWQERKAHLPDRPKGLRKRRRTVTSSSDVDGKVKRQHLSGGHEDESGYSQDSNNELVEDDDVSCINPAKRKRFLGKFQSLKKCSSMESTQSSNAGTSNTRDAIDVQSPSTTSTCSTSNSASLCSICGKRPIDGSFVHGLISHQTCCYKCAKNVYKSGQRCPVCNRMIEKVVQNFVC